MSFGSTERSGGFVDPAQQIAGLTRSLGTVGNLDGALSGAFDPKDAARPAAQALRALQAHRHPARRRSALPEAPKFVTEALGPVQGLLADLAALQAALDRAKAQAAELQAHAGDVATAVGDLTDALAVLLDPTQPHDLDAAKVQIHGLLDAFTTTIDELSVLVPALPLSPLAKSDLEKLLRGVQPYIAGIDDAVDQVIAFVQGLDPENLEVRAKLEWTTELGKWPADADEPIFLASNPLRIAVEARAGVKTGASFDAVAELEDFSLTLIAPASLMKMRFDRLAFRAGSSGKPDVDVVFGGIEFCGPLSFVETLKEIIPLDGFSDPPFLEVSPAGVRAGFTLGLPNVAVGVFALQNISLGADCNVPFLGESLSVGFNFCTRERPFALTVAFIGGGGFLGLRISPSGLELLELSLEAGARLAVDLGVASGSIEAMLGIYMRLEGKKGSLTGYFRLRGEVDVLGLISASIELSLELTYEPPTGQDDRPRDDQDRGRGLHVLVQRVGVRRAAVRGLQRRPELRAGHGGVRVRRQLAAVGRLLRGVRLAMAVQYTVVALPRSVAPGADVHVSLFISPRLSPDGTLADFEPVTQWAKAIADPATTIALTDHTNVPYALRAALPDDPRYWDAVFPPETPVKAWDSKSLDGRTLQSYPAASGPQIAKALHAVSFGASPIDPPAPKLSPVAPLMDGLARQIGAFRETRDGMVYDESLATRFFDRVTKGGLAGIGRQQGIRAGEGLMGALGDLHQARRFFERPESEQRAQGQARPRRGQPAPARPRARLPRAPDAARRPARAAAPPRLGRRPHRRRPRAAAQRAVADRLGRPRRRRRPDPADPRPVQGGRRQPRHGRPRRRRLARRAAARRRHAALRRPGPRSRRERAEARPLPLDDPAAAVARGEGRARPRRAADAQGPRLRRHARRRARRTSRSARPRPPRRPSRSSRARTPRSSTPRTSRAACGSRSGTTRPRAGSPCTRA